MDSWADVSSGRDAGLFPWAILLIAIPTLQFRCASRLGFLLAPRAAAKNFLLTVTLAPCQMQSEHVSVRLANLTLASAHEARSLEKTKD